MADEASGKTVFIAGPTASGKSAAALAFAERCGGEIVNADALQVYRDLRILSARPGPEEEALAPHHLFGFVDGAERCSAGLWARSAAAAIAAIHDRGKTAVVVGGTGLYFRALEQGLSPMPDIPSAIRSEAAKRFEAVGPDAFRAEVLAHDPALAWIPAGDRQRLIRAYEVYKATGVSLSAFQAASRVPLLQAVTARVVIEPERTELYRAVEQRFQTMLKRGALDEAARLCARGRPRDLPVMKALGAAELIAYLDGDQPLGDAVTQAAMNTRRFAKRQLTWFRNQAPDWPRAESAQAALRLLA